MLQIILPAEMEKAWERAVEGGANRICLQELL